MAELRTILVASPTRRGETAQVLRVLAHIAVWSTALLFASHLARLTGPVRDGLAIDELAFATLDGADQRMFRNALAGAQDAEDTRARTRGWPTIETLAQRHVPPFAPDPIDRAGYRWTLLRDGTVINYVGTPEPASKRPTFVIVIVEPDPGTANDPGAPTDETHHRLPDGTMLHVMIWFGTHAVTSPLAAPRLEDGWRRITITSNGARS